MSAQTDAAVDQAQAALAAALTADRSADAAELAQAKAALTQAQADDTADKAKIAALVAVIAQHGLNPDGSPIVVTPPPPPPVDARKTTATWSLDADGTYRATLAAAGFTPDSRRWTNPDGTGGWSGLFTAGTVTGPVLTGFSAGQKVIVALNDPAKGDWVSTAVTAPTAPVTPPVTPPAGSPQAATAAKLAKIVLPAAGWISGSAGLGVDGLNPAFGANRHRPLEGQATWVDNVDASASQAVLKPGGGAAGMTGALDISVTLIRGGAGETWHDAALNIGKKFTNRWTDFLTTMRPLRGNGAWLTFIRGPHEHNGNWYPDSVADGELADYHTACLLFRSCIDAVFPEAFFTCSVNAQTVGHSYGWPALWTPGAHEILSFDKYFQYPTIITAADYLAHQNDTGPGGEGWGFEAARQIALALDVPMIISEWSGVADLGDPDGAVSEHYKWVQKNKGKGPGQVLAEFQFNVDINNHTFLLYGPGVARMPKAAAMYAQLW